MTIALRQSTISAALMLASNRHHSAWSMVASARLNMKSAITPPNELTSDFPIWLSQQPAISERPHGCSHSGRAPASEDTGPP